MAKLALDTISEPASLNCVKYSLAFLGDVHSRSCAVDIGIQVGAVGVSTHSLSMPRSLDMRGCSLYMTNICVKNDFSCEWQVLIGE